MKLRLVVVAAATLADKPHPLTQCPEKTLPKHLLFQSRRVAVSNSQTSEHRQLREPSTPGVELR